MVRQISGLQRIPGVGPSIAKDLRLVGIQEVADLRGRNPESLYAALCEQVGHHVDRCVLYVFRCAVYFASESTHDPELLKWWNWQDATAAQSRRPASARTRPVKTGDPASRQPRALGVSA